MSFWSYFLPRGQPFLFAHQPASANLQAALAEAGRTPLDDMTTRVVIASPDGGLFADLGVFMRHEALKISEKREIHRIRRELLPGFQKATTLVNLSEEGKEAIAFGAMAYFDVEFTRGANAGKTSETAWNTLALDFDASGGVTRSALRLDYPVGPIDLSLDRVLEKLMR